MPRTKRRPETIDAYRERTNSGELHDDRCATRRGGECNCPSAVFKKPIQQVAQDHAKHIVKMWARSMKSGLTTLIDEMEIDHNTTVAELLDILIRKEKTGE